VQPRARDLLDAREWLAFDRTESSEVDHRYTRQRRSCLHRRSSAARERSLHEGLDVTVGNAALGARALHLREIHAEFARQLAHGRSRMGTRKSGLVDASGRLCRFS
jgi:hypothetical protein